MLKRFCRWILSDECIHDWGDWSLHGYTYQQRACNSCGKIQTEDA